MSFMTLSEIEMLETVDQTVADAITTKISAMKHKENEFEMFC